MKFTAKERMYEIDQFGVITQTDHRPFIYDAKYSSTYDKPEYKSDVLQALRLGFTIGAHGKPINSIMDVGYGNGAFLKFAQQHIKYVYGHDITGVDLPGVYIMPEFIKADVYTFFDVLEHFPDTSWLKNLPCETTIVSLPYCHFHTEGKEWFENYRHLKPDEHIRHFNEWSLPAFMNQYGWRAVALSYHEDIIRKGEKINILSMGFKRWIL